MADEPTPAEALRGVADVTRRLELLAERMERTYVTREVYLLGLGDHARRIQILEDENEAREKEDADRRKQLTFIVIGAAFTAVASFLVSMSTLLARGALGG